MCHLQIIFFSCYWCDFSQVMPYLPMIVALDIINSTYNYDKLKILLMTIREVFTVFVMFEMRIIIILSKLRTQLVILEEVFTYYTQIGNYNSDFS